MNTKPHKVPEDFRPSHRVWELAIENKMDQDFVKSQVKEFIFYFQEKGTLRKSWQRSYWNWLKKGWFWKQQREAKNSANVGASNRMDFDGNVADKLDVNTNRERLKKLRQSVGV